MGQIAFDAVWCLAYPIEARSAYEEIMSISIAIGGSPRFPQTTDIQMTDRAPTIPTHWLASHESTKTSLAYYVIL